MLLLLLFRLLRPLQIAGTGTRMALRVHENLCTVLPQRFYFPTQYSRILIAIVQHSTLNLLHSHLMFQVSLKDLSQSNIQIL